MKGHATARILSAELLAQDAGLVFECFGTHGSIPRISLHGSNMGSKVIVTAIDGKGNRKVARSTASTSGSSTSAPAFKIEAVVWDEAPKDLSSMDETDCLRFIAHYGRWNPMGAEALMMNAIEKAAKQAATAKSEMVATGTEGKPAVTKKLAKKSVK